MERRILTLRFIPFFLIISCVLGTGTAIPADDVLSVKLPNDPMTFQPSPGSEIATSYCMICHSAEYVYMQPAHSQETWKDIVRKMKGRFGCPIPEDQIPLLVSYLVSQNSQPLLITTTTQMAQAESSSASQGSTGMGKKVFHTYCVNCHGASGKGDGPIGRSLIPPAADLTKTAQKGDKELLNTIKNGKPGTAMPSWKHDLSNKEIEEVLDYIRKLAQR